MTPEGDPVTNEDRTGPTARGSALWDRLAGLRAAVRSRESIVLAALGLLLFLVLATGNYLGLW
ncbi:hypothetical protein C488_12146 [Natrinema pellirubrum DSM 15624]|uniref:Uncharacterized protein n=1 Tax=Natrinema pellirubrum (strain DSM 15624 / CIP 106293 / JCM 10476 / NCIMB 786 / 157) TaxID=797303 RepID=L0JNJ8_NATP1|nr:hypothetical protein [Natrinema pellirubrum]AGB32413.1 hypothetical protein Natpe_2605 [Natrinema pellirubrum DSM 15624]ELY73902.1 hypothetical protein C488_12146 [Natrinema pellirubrum DSM 15624]